ncbi:MAG: hypothetical protein LAO31_13575 [Acidobacteriia bacterium]|nr:hypothetical protein [Terriglobia bacterium]
MGFQKPVWIEQGPGPLAIPMGNYNKSAGAIQAVVVDPVTPNRVFVATVGGGIWMSNNALAAVDPSWLPLTDHSPSLTMSTLAMSPLDQNRNTLYAGSGRTTHGLPLVGPAGGPLFGMLKTVDGGTTWNEIGRNVFQGKFVARILPVNAKTKQGDLVLAATLEGGLHISPDGGATWGLSNAVNAPVTDVAADPAKSMRVYVAATQRVFRSEDAADKDWHDITPGDWWNLPGWSTIRFTVSPSTDLKGNHWLYASATGAAGNVSILFTPDQGTNWYPVGMPPDNSIAGSPMAVSPLRPDALFNVTDAGSPNNWMAIVSPGHATQWTLVESQGANGTGPHTDARDCVFVPDGSVLYETNDGGIFRLVNPHGLQNLPPRKWSEAVGNIRVAEFIAIAYDSVNHVLFGATQDNAIPQQTVQGGLDWEINEEPWGDGFEVGVDVSSVQGAAIHYSSQQNLFRFIRRTYTAPKQVTASQYLDLVIAGTGGEHYNQVEGSLRDDGGLGTVRWNQSWAVNAADPTRILLGTDFLYESFDRGDNFTSLGGLANNKNGEWIPANPVGTVSAYAYGHRDNMDVIYLGAGGKLLLRAGKAGLPTNVATYPGGMPVGVVMDPDDWRRAYVLDGSGRVFRTMDAGAMAGGWSELTGNLPQLSGDLRSIQVMPRGAVNGMEVVFAAGYGGVFVAESTGDGRFAMWRKHGFNFPNAVVTDLHYNATDDVLVAGTYGRAAWALPNASSSLVGEPRSIILSSQQNLCVQGWVEGSVVTFSAKMTGGAPLTGPLSFQWTVLGGVAQPPLTAPQVVVTMPPAGTEVVIILTVTDATGYEVVGLSIGMSVTEDVAIQRALYCWLIDKINQETIFNPFTNPLGPDVGPDIGIDNPVGPWGPAFGPTTIGGLPDYAGLHQLMSRFTQVLGNLAKNDRVKASQPTLYQMSEGAVRRWAALEAATGRVTVSLGPSDAAPDGRG